MVAKLWFRPFQEEDARTVASWRYPEPYSAYDLNPHSARVIQAMLDPRHNYHAIFQGDEIIGYFCLGDDARVPGWVYDDSALDVGMGLRPDLTGRGAGKEYFEVVIRHIEQQPLGTALRATIVGWNQRAIRLCLNAGFRPLANFRASREGRQVFVVLLREALTA